MTFIPNVLSTIDNHNSTTTTTTSTIFTGTLTNTIGYNEINIYIRSNQNSDPLGLEIQFSNDKLTWTTKYKDTYFTKGLCPIAEEMQPRLMVFKTNYRDLKIAKSKAQILYKLIKEIG